MSILRYLFAKIAGQRRLCSTIKFMNSTAALRRRRQTESPSPRPGVGARPTAGSIDVGYRLALCDQLLSGLELADDLLRGGGGFFPGLLSCLVMVEYPMQMQQELLFEVPEKNCMYDQIKPAILIPSPWKTC